MTTISIIGAGNMAQAIGTVAAAGGASVEFVARDAAAALAAVPGSTAVAFGEPFTGDTVVLAVPYPAVASILESYDFTGKTVIDITNPLDFATFDSLVVPAGSSAAAEIAAAVPGASVLKAFNTTFAGTLHAGTVGENRTTVLIAGDDTEAKAALAAVVTAGGLNAIDAGALNRAHELEALGFLQLTLAAAEKIGWTGGFATVA